MAESAPARTPSQEDNFDPITALRLDKKSSVNVWLAIGACTYASISIVLLLVNFMQCKNSYFDVFGQGCPDVPLLVSGDAVHRVEFTSAFLFNCINLLIVAYSDSDEVYKNAGVFKMWAFVNLLFSTTAMILVWADRPNFEVPAHQMEYISEISMSFLETRLLSHAIQKAAGESGMLSKMFKNLSELLNLLPFLLAVLQLWIFNKGGFFFDVPGDWKGQCSFLQYRINMLTGDASCDTYGDATGEWYAHCLEYIVGFLNAIQAFFIALDNKMNADSKLQEIVKNCKEAAGSKSSYQAPSFAGSSSDRLDQSPSSEAAATRADDLRRIEELERRRDEKRRQIQ